ncbi:MAG: iron ABC transporter permease [Rhizobiales bacterium]|nr:iron ABC transporter permease [Hyphomicrobiales bacterium]
MAATDAKLAPRRSRGERRLIAGALAVSLLVASPVLAIVVIALSPTGDVWGHLVSTVLPGYAATTLQLMLGVGIVTFLIGTGAAWFVTMYAFPGRRVVDWLLMLPLAMPTYLIAYTYVDVLAYSGPVQSGLREAFGWQSARDYWFPEIRSVGGAIFVMAFVLYPYVYLTVRAAFVQQSLQLIEASRTLGHALGSSFVKVALPLARPAIVAGIILALMECLNDLGAVQYFGVNTLTAGVYTTWLHRNNLGGAAQIALVMLVFVFVLVLTERWARRGRRFIQATGHERPPERERLKGPWRWIALMLCLVPIILGFFIPAGVLVAFALRRIAEQDIGRFASEALNSLTLSVLAASVAVLIGLFLAHAARTSRVRPVRIASVAASIGYAVPGTVLAIGILVPLARFDNALDAFARQAFDFSTGLLLTGTMFSIVFAYVVRFMAVSYGAIDAGYARLSPHLPMAARSLGRTPFQALREVQLPLMKPAIVAAALLVFVDSMKELPATLLLRPFNFDTLATQVYTYASLALVEEAALPALAIVAVGIIPVLALNHTMALATAGVAQVHEIVLSGQDKDTVPGAHAPR